MLETEDQPGSERTKSNLVLGIAKGSTWATGDKKAEREESDQQSGDMIDLMQWQRTVSMLALESCMEQLSSAFFVADIILPLLNPLCFRLQLGGWDQRSAPSKEQALVRSRLSMLVCVFHTGVLFAFISHHTYFRLFCVSAVLFLIITLRAFLGSLGVLRLPLCRLCLRFAHVLVSHSNRTIVGRLSALLYLKPSLLTVRNAPAELARLFPRSAFVFRLCLSHRFSGLLAVCCCIIASLSSPSRVFLSAQCVIFLPSFPFPHPLRRPLDQKTATLSCEPATLAMLSFPCGTKSASSTAAFSNRRPACTSAPVRGRFRLSPHSLRTTRSSQNPRCRVGCASQRQTPPDRSFLGFKSAMRSGYEET